MSEPAAAAKPQQNTQEVPATPELTGDEKPLLAGQAKVSTSPTLPSHPPAARMGSNIGGDSASDADTQEPSKTVMEQPQVEDSDAEDVGHKSQDSADGKMRQMIERINADSDRSDDEGNEERGNEDEQLDFGDEVEEDVVVHVPQKVQELENMEESKGKKKDRKKDSGPVKSIKKTSAEGKGKGKTGKAKAVALVRKKDASPKGKKAASPKASPRHSPKTSPKPEKKTISKTSAKGPGKADAKSQKAKAAAKGAAEKEKAVKPKKTISKEDKKTAKKPLVIKSEKKKTAVKTFSKKANAVSAKTSPKGKKAATTKKTKSTKAAQVKNAKKVKKVKGTATPSKSSEEEDIDQMVVEDSEEEGNASDSDEDMEESTKTPGSKLPILGNLACSSRDGNASALLEHAVQQLGKYNIVSYGPDSDCNLHAYIIGKETKRGWGLLQALACGVPLVSEDWLSSSISEGKWKPMDVFRSDQFGQSPRSVDATAQPNRILDGQRIKVVSDNKDVGSIRKLLALCGARVAETRMDVIINDSAKPVKGCVNVSKKWLADSVEAGEPLDYDAYVLKA